MQNEHGALNLEEAAKYLGVSSCLLKALCWPPEGALHYPSPAYFPDDEELHLFPGGPWFPMWSLDEFKPLLPRILEQAQLVVISDPGEAKSRYLKAGSVPA